ncbi:hypothetical protein [Chitinimonas taiwanensis]|uniref:Uncharacterized protein n=1 Tax=Chitinimonas taiwanensis DSM 18899 TaxID=1121279 RepID=A0A1K2H839_9NEIS|nr:hypothetical protein [Chitinimonas taiwanensis]SFZ72039.1 hypothetical protein SAMN02745887_00519 [Chitinimonas taiwanensis DSM 18899]
MKIKAIFSSIVALCAVSVHSKELLLGNFGHAFTGKESDIVWSIRAKGSIYEILFHGDNSKATAQQLSDKAVAKLWKKLDWPEITTAGVVCLGVKEDFFCYVPQEQRKKISWIADNKSDYFNYSSMGGVMEIHKKKP